MSDLPAVPAEATVYAFDTVGKELARSHDLPYCPEGNGCIALAALHKGMRVCVNPYAGKVIDVLHHMATTKHPDPLNQDARGRSRSPGGRGRGRGGGRGGRQ